MNILAIETSCDETSAAILKGDIKKQGVELLSNVIATSLGLHTKTGGIIPEVAAREQIKYIIPVIEKALADAKLSKDNIDKIAVTVGPGLIGSLLVGVETAKTFAYILEKPIIPVNHLFGHIYANWIGKEEETRIKFPALSLIISGGHTDLVLIEKHGTIKWLGGTKDDAAGEAFDKIGRLLNLPYPAGPVIETLSENVKEDIYKFPRPMIYDKSFDFSFSGLKAAVFRETEKNKTMNDEDIKNIAFSTQEAIFDVLTKKTLKAIYKYKPKSLLLGGGVAANQTLRKRFESEIKNLKLEISFFVPDKKLCTDNAAMIGAAAFFIGKEKSWEKVDANPELYFD